MKRCVSSAWWNSAFVSTPSDFTRNIFLVNRLIWFIYSYYNLIATSSNFESLFSSSKVWLVITLDYLRPCLIFNIRIEIQHLIFSNDEGICKKEYPRNMPMNPPRRNSLFFEINQKWLEKRKPLLVANCNHTIQSCMFYPGRASGIYSHIEIHTKRGFIYGSVQNVWQASQWWVSNVFNLLFIHTLALTS